MKNNLASVKVQALLEYLPVPIYMSKCFLIGLLAFCCFSQSIEAQQPLSTSTSDQNAGEIPATGTISGIVLDRNDNLVPATIVTLKNVTGGSDRQSIPDRSGTFLFNNVPAGSFQIVINAPGFQSITRTGALRAGESLVLPDTRLAIGLTMSEVRVTETAQELAEEQVHVEEKQRVLGVIPNFYVSYDRNPLPLTPRQKYELAWKTSLDPVNFLATGVVAGIEQATNTFSGFGQGTAGYAKRYAASYGDGLIGGYLGSAILPALFKQDPRYFYKGEGTVTSRAEYAIANAVICKGDNGHWQVNYSGIGGGLAAGAISNLYYPAANRNGVGLTFENGLIGIGSGAIANLFQEFLVRKLTPHTHDAKTAQP